MVTRVEGWFIYVLLLCKKTGSWTLPLCRSGFEMSKFGLSILTCYMDVPVSCLVLSDQIIYYMDVLLLV
jgi:hypothetical protein